MDTEALTEALRAFAPETFTWQYVSGFSFDGERDTGDGQAPDQVLLMRSGNPFQSGESAQLYISDSGQIIACGKPILKFSLSWISCLWAAPVISCHPLF